MDLSDPQSWPVKLRRLLVPSLAALICSIFVVVKPISDLGGNYGFLFPTTLLLFFFPNNTLTLQVEITLVNVLSGALGLAWACVTLAIAAVCGTQYGADSDAARAVIGVGLASLAITCGFIRSLFHSARTTSASRIALFFPIFLLTSSQAVTSMKPQLFLNQFYVILFAAATGLSTSLLLLPHSPSARLGRLVSASLATPCELLHISLSVIIGEISGQAALDEKGIGSPLNESTPSTIKHSTLSERLKYNVMQLQPTFAQYKTRNILNHDHSAILQGLIHSIQQIARNPLMAPLDHAPGERLRVAIDKARASRNILDTGRVSRFLDRPESPASRRTSKTALGEALERGLPDILRSPVDPSGTPQSNLRFARKGRPACDQAIGRTMSSLQTSCDRLVSVVQRTLHVSARNLEALLGDHRQMSVRDNRTKPQDSSSEITTDLDVSCAELQVQLITLLGWGHASDRDAASHGVRDGVETEEKAPVVGFDIDRRDFYRLAFYMVALLDFARDVTEVLTLSTRAGKLGHGAKGSVSSSMQISALFRSSHSASDFQNGLAATNTTTDAGLQESNGSLERYDHWQDLDFARRALHEDRHPLTLVGPANRLERIWKASWGQKSVLRVRIAVSTVLNQMKNSRHVVHSLKLAVGVSALALPAFLPTQSRGRQWFDTYHGAWMVISYMYVLEMHTGAILKVGFYRLLGTFVGALAGLTSAYIAHENPFALVILCSACFVPISYLVLFTNVPALGIVAGITLPPILFLPYLGLAAGQTKWTIAWRRFVEIAIGIAAAILVGTLVRPNHARVRYFRVVSRTLDKLTEYYLRMSRDHLRSSLVYQAPNKQYDHLDADIRLGISTGRELCVIQKQEISLLPRPMRLYGEVIDIIERLDETMVEIRSLRFSVPRRETVLDVLPIRREMVSAIMVNMWAVGQAFRTRSPLPQFLPSPRTSLSDLMDAVDGHAHQVRRDRQSVLSGEGSTDESSKEWADRQADMAILYAMAENEALGEMCDIIEQLVAAARTLFGSHTFLDDRDISGDATGMP